MGAMVARIDAAGPLELPPADLVDSPAKEVESGSRELGRAERTAVMVN